MTSSPRARQKSTPPVPSLLRWREQRGELGATAAAKQKVLHIWVDWLVGCGGGGGDSGFGGGAVVVDNESVGADIPVVTMVVP